VTSLRTSSRLGELMNSSWNLMNAAPGPL
jgi:hypothetical protein